jgi:hypothetical protein
MKAVSSARLLRRIVEAHLIPNAIDMGFSHEFGINTFVTRRRDPASR